MNLKNLFINRDKNFARLTEAGDYLGRRLRENLVIFELDDAKQEVTFVTESSNLIHCTYSEIKGRLTLENFKVEDLESVTSDEAIDNRVDEQVHQFMSSLTGNRFDAAEVNFDKIVEAFSMRAQIETSRKKLNKKLDRFNESYNVFSTKAYRKFNEALPLLKKYLEENRDALGDNSKIVEGLRLSKAVGDTYDLPKLTVDQLQEEFVVVPPNSKKTLYEMVCEKELVRKELLESKEAFSRMWHSNDSIATLASHIYSTDGEIKRALKESVASVPYLALCNKVDLVSVMDSTYQVQNPGTIPQKDIREFVNKIYEFKKPLKTFVLETLNSKYGVNVQSLRFVPSFKGLAEIQGEVLGMIAETCEEGILADVLNEFANCISRKGGVQVLDIANTLSHVMEEANFTVVDVDETFEMKKLADYLKHNLSEAQYYGDDDAMSNSGGNAGEGENDDSEKTKKKKKKKDKDWGGNKGDIKAKDRKEDDDSDLEADEKGDVDYNTNDLPKNNKAKKGKVVKEDENEEKPPTVEGKKLSKKQSEKMDTDKDGDIDGKDLKKLRKEQNESEMEPETADQAQMADEEGDAEPDDNMADEEAMQKARDTEWRDMVADLTKVTRDIDMDFADEPEEEVNAPEEE
tara:strand:+ start:935 stop:2827 length:1893 start_codon:yes stop_codon:yes gene_type:complete